MSTDDGRMFGFSGDGLDGHWIHSQHFSQEEIQVFDLLDHLPCHWFVSSDLLIDGFSQRLLDVGTGGQDVGSVGQRRRGGLVSLNLTIPFDVS